VVESDGEGAAWDGTGEYLGNNECDKCNRNDVYA
jgi:hypothetical protein